MYVPFSVFYQAFVVKQWCLLCLGVQLVLMTGFLWSLNSYWWGHNKFSFSVNNAIYFTISFIMPATCWFLIKPSLLKYKDMEIATTSFKRLVFNPDTFKSLLQAQPAAADGWQNIGIGLGNLHAENTIIKVCNPYCRPCAKAHPLLEEIIVNRPNYSLKIIFTVSSDINDIKNNPTKHLLSIASRNNPSEIHTALNDWYLTEEKNYDQFSKKYPLEKDISAANENLIKMQEWCNASFISHTPTIFVNGHRIPDNYSIDDLQYVL